MFSVKLLIALSGYGLVAAAILIVLLWMKIPASAKPFQIQISEAIAVLVTVGIAMAGTATRVLGMYSICLPPLMLAGSVLGLLASRCLTGEQRPRRWSVIAILAGSLVWSILGLVLNVAQLDIMGFVVGVAFMIVAYQVLVPMPKADSSNKPD